MPIAINSITVPQDGVPVSTLPNGECFVFKNDQDNIYMVMPHGPHQPTMIFSLMRRSMEQSEDHVLVYPVRIAAIAQVCRNRKIASDALKFTIAMRQNEEAFEFTAKCAIPMAMQDKMVRGSCFEELCKMLRREIVKQWGDF